MRRAGASLRIPPSQISDDPKRHVSDYRRVKLFHRPQTGRLSAAAYASDRFAVFVVEVVTDDESDDEVDEIGATVVRYAADAVAQRNVRHGRRSDPLSSGDLHDVDSATYSLRMRSRSFFGSLGAFSRRRGV